MDAYDLELAFYRRLIALTYATTTTARPDEVFDPQTLPNTQVWRRGSIIGPFPETVGFGDGVYSRLYGIYQIDIYVPRTNNGALKELKNMTDAHVVQFWPSDGRGLTLTENSTSANIVKRPSQRHLGREGAYLRELVEVDFYVEEFPS